MRINEAVVRRALQGEALEPVWNERLLTVELGPVPAVRTFDFEITSSAEQPGAVFKLVG